MPKVLVDPGIVAQVKLWGCLGFFGCPEVDLRRIRATEEPDRGSALHEISILKINLANCFIHLSKSPAKAPILFDKKLDRSFCLYINYQGLNNITIKNQ